MAEAIPPDAPARKRRWLAIAVIAVLGLVGIPSTIYLVWAWRISEAMKPTIVETDEPVSLTEARRMSYLPIPDSAREIRYARYTEFIALTEVLRFEAPVDDCKTFAEGVVADHNRRNSDRTVKGLRPLPTTGPAATGRLGSPAHQILEPLQVPWFAPDSIRSGMQAGELGSHRPMLWIDLKRGIVYYLLTD